jgi:hypothetical protein
MNTYKDKFISFNLLLPLNDWIVKHRFYNHWLIKPPCVKNDGNTRDFMSIAIDITESKSIYDAESITIVKNNTKFIETVVGDYKTYYKILVSDLKNSYYDSSCRILMVNKYYIINVEIYKYNSDINFCTYIPFLESISINHSHLLNAYKQEETRRKKSIKEYLVTPLEKRIPMILPIGFTFGKLKPFGNIILISEQMTISVSDDSIFGYKADIDEFIELQKKGQADATMALFPMKRKRCLVTNLIENENIDFSRCRKIRILLAFGLEHCYTINMESDYPFDLNEYKNFLNSIGVKRKKSSKNK